MREIFAVASPHPDPGEVFYTLRPEDVGKVVIDTEIGLVHVGDLLGRVLPGDAGRRLYRMPVDLVPGEGEPGRYTWQMESHRQFTLRTRRSEPA